MLNPGSKLQSAGEWLTGLWSGRSRRTAGLPIMGGAGGLLGAAGLGAQTRAASVPDSMDRSLVISVVFLVLLGLVMVYSATIGLPDSARSEYASKDPTYWLVRHAAYVFIGSLAGFMAWRVPMDTWQRLAPWIFVGGLFLLAMVLIPGIGKKVLGARRWISLAGFTLQPSEIMKLAVLLYAADYTVRKQDYMQRFSKGFLPMATATALVGMLVLLEPDFGAFVVIVCIAMGILFLGGLNGKLFVGLTLTLLVTCVVLVVAFPYRLARVLAFRDPFGEDNVLNGGYQLANSLIAFGSGEWFGVGLGNSMAKLYYLPEAHTDFLLAVVGEELGLVGVLLVVLAFYMIVRRSFDIGRQAAALNHFFGCFVAKGVGLWIGVQGFINMGVNLGLLPTKGLTLPLMSYGGTGIVINLVAIAVLLRVDHENRRLMRGTRR